MYNITCILCYVIRWNKCFEISNYRQSGSGGIADIQIAYTPEFGII